MFLKCNVDNQGESLRIYWFLQIIKGERPAACTFHSQFYILIPCRATWAFVRCMKEICWEYLTS
jgi:hypothetical protein